MHDDTDAPVMCTLPAPAAPPPHVTPAPPPLAAVPVSPDARSLPVSALLRWLCVWPDVGRRPSAGSTEEAMPEAVVRAAVVEAPLGCGWCCMEAPTTE